MVKLNKKIVIDGREIGEGHPAYIIAEAGVAHFGSLDKAMSLVDMAVQAGSDAIKFQIFKTEALISKESSEWRKRLRSRELPFESFSKIQRYCMEKGITFFATAHDETGLKFLNKMDVPAYKVGSGEVSNWPFLKKIGSLGKPVIFSTGMYTLEQVDEAFKYLTSNGNQDIAVLHCVTNYPVSPEKANLRAIETLKNSFHAVTGYSDHTQGFHFPLAAVTMGAKIIEKHISLDFNVPDAQDWKVSCGKDDLKKMINQIRDIEKGLGTGRKDITSVEAQSLAWARKSLVTAVDIGSGDILTSDKITAKRPGTGIAPSKMNEVLGKRVVVDLPYDAIIKWEHLK